MEFETAIFPTESQPDYNRKRIKSLIFIIGLISLVILFSIPFIAKLSIWLSIFVFMVFILLLVYGYRIEKRTYLKVSFNGWLTIDKYGFNFEHELNEFISYDTIKQIEYSFDRPISSYLFSHSGPSARTYNLTITTNNNIKHTFYIQRHAKFGYRKVHGDFVDTMEALRMKNLYFYKIIKRKY